MKPITFVTIDWDFFNDYPRSARDDFPPITDGNVGSVPDNTLWHNCDCLFNYRLIPRSKERFSADKFDILMRALRSRLDAGLSIDRVFISENHGYAFRAVETCLLGHPDTTPISVYNIDYHHDYSYCGTTLRCDNWMRLVQEKYPHAKLFWCGRRDSDETSFGERVPVEQIDIFKALYEVVKTSPNLVIHVCRSDLYSPPAFDWAFNELCYYLCGVAKKSLQYEKIEMDRERKLLNTEGWYCDHV